MVSFTLTKQGILKAIEKNELIHKVFFWSLSNHPREVSLKDCKVCAVGAVIRECILNKRATQVDGSGLALSLVKGGSIFNDVEAYLAEKDYLAALSSFFECKDRDLRLTKAEVKRQTLAFVKQNFPTKFKILVHDQYKEKLRCI